MVEADLRAVLEIERASFTMPWTLETFRGLLRRADALLWVAESDDARVIAYAAVWIVLDQAELGDIAVAEPWRGRGVGRRLLDTVLAAMAGRGVREIYLEVRPSNLRARRLYEHYGFRQVGTRRHYYERPREDALVLRRWIQPAAAAGPGDGARPVAREGPVEPGHDQETAGSGDSGN